MESIKKRNLISVSLWKKAILSIGFFLSLSISSECSLENSSPHNKQGHILFLLKLGEHEQALKLYQSYYQQCGKHDYDLLHQVGLRILDYGFRKNDPECQLLALFGASVSAHEDAYYILEESVKSRFPAIQLVSLNALARFQNDRADQAILKGLSASTLEVRYEAAHQLCKKKHPQAICQTESLLYKTPKAYMALYPALFAMVDDPHSTRILRKLLNQSSSDIRLAVILNAAKYQRDDLLPQIRQQSAQFQFALQEACASTFGILKDEESISKLEKLALSQYPTVALAAHVALFKLGKEESLEYIEQAALKEDLFAIATLGSIQDHPKALLNLLDKTNLQVRMNALISLAKQHNPKGMEFIGEVLIRDQRDLAFTSYQSPGQSFKAWKVTPSASQMLKDDIKAYLDHIELKESLLEIVCELSQPQFIKLADQIFAKQQNDLIPRTTELLENLGNAEAINCLKQTNNS